MKERIETLKGVVSFTEVGDREILVIGENPVMNWLRSRYSLLRELPPIKEGDKSYGTFEVIRGFGSVLYPVSSMEDISAIYSLLSKLTGEVELIVRYEEEEEQ